MIWALLTTDTFRHHLLTIRFERSVDQTCGGGVSHGSLEAFGQNSRMAIRTTIAAAPIPVRTAILFRFLTSTPERSVRPVTAIAKITAQATPKPTSAAKITCQTSTTHPEIACLLGALPQSAC